MTSHDSTPRIGMLTMQGVLSNYGTLFQFTALSRVLAAIAPQCERVRISRRSAFEERRWFACRILYHLLKNPNHATFCRLVFGFRRFYKRYFGAVVDPNQEASICIVGSDQVFTNEEVLGLLDERIATQKIAYAASADWGMASSPAWAERVRKNFSNFTAVSVREARGINICQPLCENCKVVRVMDPVGLLTQEAWKSYAAPRKTFRKPTLFAYFLNEPAPVAELTALAQQLQVELKVTQLQGAATHIPNNLRYFPTPDEFLAAIRDADYVVTNSFHGTLLALLLEKRFLSVTQNSSQDTRQKELLERVNLQERRITASEIVKSQELLQGDPAWDHVRAVFQKERETSIAWLAEALKQVTHTS